MTWDPDRFPDIAVPSILPLPPPPDTPEESVEYIRVLHEVLRAHQTRLSRALTILGYYRSVQGTEAERPDPVGSGALYMETDTGSLQYDARLTSPSETPVWQTLVSGNVEWAGPTNIPTGFLNPGRAGDSTIGIEAGPNFFIEPKTDKFSIYLAGELFEKTAKETLDLSAAEVQEGNWFIYYNNDGNLVLDDVVTFEEILRDNAFVAELYSDGTSLQFLMDERHGLMPWETHLWAHLESGTIRRSGFGLTNFDVDGTGNVDAHAECQAATGMMVDEDLLHTLAVQSGTWDLIYHSAGAWVFEPAAGAAPVKLVGGIPQVWDSGTDALVDVTSNRFFLAHIFGTNLVTNGSGTAVNGHAVIIGQAEYATIIAARDGANTEIGSIITTGLPVPEFLPIGTVILQRKGTNAYNCAVRSTDAGEDYVSWLGAEIQPGNPPSAHPNLTQRDLDDQHPASAIATDTTNFDEALSAADDDVQKAIETLDDRGIGSLIDVTLSPIAENNIIVFGGAGAWINLPIQNFLSLYLALAGGTMTGDILLASGVSLDTSADHDLLLKRNGVLKCTIGANTFDFEAGPLRINGGFGADIQLWDGVSAYIQALYMNGLTDLQVGDPSAANLTLNGMGVRPEYYDNSTTTALALLTDTGAGTDTDAIHDNVAGEINALTLIGPDDSDIFLIEDASDSFNKKRTTLRATRQFNDGNHYLYITCKNNTGSAMAANDIVYISGDASGVPEITLADADAAASAGTPMVAVCQEAINNGANGRVQIFGVKGGFSGLTAGAVQYIHTTAGDLTETAPSGSGDIVRVFGHAISTTEVFVNPSNSWVEVA